MEKIIDNKYFEASIRDRLAVVSLKNEVFELITSLEESEVMMEFIRSSEHNPAVRGLLLLNRQDCIGEPAYERFVKGILGEPVAAGSDESPCIVERNTRFRQINILNRFIRFLAGYHKLVIVGIDSTIVTPFMGVALVADVRLASPYGAFALAHRNYGLHPSGAIPFLLSHYLGHAKAIEIQLSDRLTAEDAYRLGLINQILPSDKFEENCIRFVQPMVSHCRSTLTTTKRLNNFKNNGLQDYLEHESSIINL
jgi:enoyl-CoA hydratase/carnithine racemase